MSGFFLASKGEYDDSTGMEDTSGNAIKLEGKMPLGKAKISAMVLSASGSTDGKDRV